MHLQRLAGCSRNHSTHTQHPTTATAPAPCPRTWEHRRRPAAPLAAFLSPPPAVNAPAALPCKRNAQLSTSRPCSHVHLHGAQQAAAFQRPLIVASATVSSNLAGVLKDELKYERESYRKDEELPDQPPAGFELDDPPNKACFYLQKHVGNKHVFVEVDITDQPEPLEDDLDEDEDAWDEEVLFKVTVSNEQQSESLTAEYSYQDDTLVIKHIGLDSLYTDGVPAYTGPVFEDLDETLQQALMDYMEDFGIDAELGEYIRLKIQDKAELEYQLWLERMKQFVSSK